MQLNMVDRKILECLQLIEPSFKSIGEASNGELEFRIRQDRDWFMYVKWNTLDRWWYITPWNVDPHFDEAIKRAVMLTQKRIK